MTTPPNTLTRTNKAHKHRRAGMKLAAVRRRANAYLRSNTFSIVVAPATMSLIGLYFADVLGKPAVAAFMTIGIAVGFSVLFMVFPRQIRMRAPLADADIEVPAADGLVVLMSATTNGTSQGWRSSSAQGTIIDALKPHHIAAIGTDVSARSIDFLNQCYGERVVATLDLGTNEDHDALAVSRAVRKAVRMLLDAEAQHVAVDVTGGTKVMSIGAYEAAASEGAMAVYLTQGTPTRVIRVLDEDTDLRAKTWN